MTLDLLIRGARLPRSKQLQDIGIAGGRIVSLSPETPSPLAGEGRGGGLSQAREVIDVEGSLVTPALVEPHIHLDAVLTAGDPRPNLTGSLFEGIAIWAERVKRLTVNDVKQRAREVLRWQLANGVLHVRSHVDVCEPELRALRGLVELREELGDQIDLQLVAFPQQGIYSFDDGERLMREAVKIGADVVGGIPHYELTREYGERSVRFSMELAAEHSLMVDIHCDETDDDQSRFLEVMAAETIRLRMQGRVTASHTTAMHSYNNAYAYRLISNVKRAGLHMVTNPLDNSVLQARFDSYPIRRGHTRVKELLAAGVNVCIGHDSVMDPWYPLGYGDPVQSAFVAVHYIQMSGQAELEALFDMITTRPAEALGIRDYGTTEGSSADLVVFAAPTEMDALRLLAPRRLVFRGGKVVARTQPSQTTVVWGGKEVPVNFLANSPPPLGEGRVGAEGRT